MLDGGVGCLLTWFPWVFIGGWVSLGFSEGFTKKDGMKSQWMASPVG